MIERIVIEDWKEDSFHSDFIKNKSDNGTIFHSIQFLNYHSESFYKDKKKIHVQFFKKNELIASITGLIYKDDGKTYFVSPYGASYGGLVVIKNSIFVEYELVYDNLIDCLKEYSVTTIKLTNTTNIHSENSKSGYCEFILLSNGFQIIKSDLLLVHELSDQSDLISRFERKTITELKQPLKKGNLSLQVLNGVDQETYLILKSSQERLNSIPTHTLEELNKIENLLPGTVKSFKIMHEGNQVAGIITFSVNNRVLNTFYIFDNYSARDLKANHFAYYSVLKWAKENGFRYLDLGPSTFGYEPNFPLIKFKEKFDVFPILRNTYIKELT